MKSRTYSELITFTSYIDRFNYLKLGGVPGVITFGYDRIFNQMFYQSTEWKHIRDHIIARDYGCDLAVAGHDIYLKKDIRIHHLNNFTMEELDDKAEILLDPEFLITTILNTHNAIHYGNENLLAKDPIVRTKNDTCPWRM